MTTECNRCLFTSDFAKIGEHQCEYCDIHDTLANNSDPLDLDYQLDKIERKGRGKKYDCLIGISGGLDSSTLLYMAVRYWGMKPLVIHFDNGWNNDIAKQNMDNLVEKLSVDAIFYRVSKNEYDFLNDAFLRAGVPDADIPNDIAMTKLMYDTAHKYGIKYILNGHDFREEGSTPAKWTYMDAEYIRSVYRDFCGLELKSYPLFTFKDQLLSWVRGIKQVRPFHYGFNRKPFEQAMISEIGWKSYGAKHCENIYTEFVGAELLPNKFGIDKRIVYLSARVRSGLMSKEDARKEFANKPVFNYEKLASHRARIQELMRSPIRERSEFKKYNFKKYRLVIWFLYKTGVVPYTFYKKYCF